MYNFFYLFVCCWFILAGEKASWCGLEKGSEWAQSQSLRFGSKRTSWTWSDLNRFGRLGRRRSIISPIISPTWLSLRYSTTVSTQSVNAKRVCWSFLQCVRSCQHIRRTTGTRNAKRAADSSCSNRSPSRRNTETTRWRKHFQRKRWSIFNWSACVPHTPRKRTVNGGGSTSVPFTP